MGSRTAARTSVSMISRVLCGFAVFGLSVGLLASQDNRSPQDVLREAEEFQNAGKIDEAIADYKNILDKYPDVPQVRSNLGAALAAAGRYEEAIAEYQKALQLAPLPEIRLNLALAYYKIGRLAPAVENLDAFRKEKPDDLRAVMLLADCDLRMGKNKEVVELLEPVERSHPDNLGITYMLGTALVRDGQVAKGQVIINKILKNGDSAEARLLLGTTKFQANDFSGALVDLQKAVDLNPNLTDLNTYYGLALMATGDQDGAQKAFERALKDDPNNFDANLRMGVLLKENQNYDEAMRHLNHALEVRPGDIGVRYQIAVIELAQGEVEKATAELEGIVKEVPNFTEAHVSLATAYYRLKKKAEGDRERAIVAKLQAQTQANQPGAKAAQ